jgi:hypothetical protein
MPSGLQIMQGPLPALLCPIIEYKRDLFDTESTGLGKVEIGNQGDKEIQGDINGIVPPLHRGEGNGIDELVESVSEVYRQLSMSTWEGWTDC